jgi:23S rRNA pseudouridine1911/1915/1917 synthase
MSNLKVLYEDNHIIAVVKPAGLLTQGDKSGDVSLYDLVKDYIREKKGKPTLHKPGNAVSLEARERSGVFLGLVHRLDKPVQGIVLFGKTSKGAGRLSEQFRNHTIQKTYHAIVLGKMEKSRGELKEKINKISFFAEGFTEKSDEELLEEIKKATKTRTAELSWEVIKSNNKFSLLKILPKTGRFHQIRVQMTNMGHPILGDTKYGKYSPDWRNKESIALAATAISFKSATEDKQINLEISLPVSWEKFI